MDWLGKIRNIQFHVATRFGLRKRVVLGTGVHACVPVVMNGEGTLRIGAGVQFGYSLAPCVGSGTILLQARDAGAIVSIGSDTEFSNNVSIIATSSVSIGERCLIHTSPLSSGAVLCDGIANKGWCHDAREPQPVVA